MMQLLTVSSAGILALVKLFIWKYLVKVFVGVIAITPGKIN